MKLSLRSTLLGAAQITRGAGGLAARMRVWIWGSLLARLLAMGAALVVFAIIGSSALAGGAPAAASSASPSPMPPAPDPLVWADAQAPAPVTFASSAEAPIVQAQSPPRGRATPEDPVILNAATLTDLERLPGIGEKRAQSILAVRARLGRFRQVEDLLKVKGIGRATLKKLRPLVRLDPPSTPQDAGAP